MSSVSLVTSSNQKVSPKISPKIQEGRKTSQPTPVLPSSFLLSWQFLNIITFSDVSTRRKFVSLFTQDNHRYAISNIVPTDRYFIVLLLILDFRLDSRDRSNDHFIPSLHWSHQSGFCTGREAGRGSGLKGTWR